MSSILFDYAKNEFLIATLPIVGAVGMAAVLAIGNELIELLRPGVRKAKAKLPAIDLALKLGSPDLYGKVKDSAVLKFAEAAFDEAGLSDAETRTAIAWVAKKFDYKIHEAADPDKASDEQKAIAKQILGRLEERLAG